MKLFQRVIGLLSKRPTSQAPAPCLHGRAVESLERRRLLSSNIDPGPEFVPDGFGANINFQPDSVGPVENTRADFGRPFATRGNGLKYGWSRDLEAAGAMVDADSDRDLPGLSYGGNIGNGPPDEAQDVDERYDTFARVDGGDEWSIAVPNGTYAVGLVGGDPSFTGSLGAVLSAWDVNGKRVVQAQPTSDYPFAEAVIIAEVTDGRIRVSVGSESRGSALSWLRVAQVQAPPTYGTGDSIDWEMSDSLPSPVPRAEGSSTVVGGKMYVVGGFAPAYSEVYRRVDVLDLATLQWSRGPDLPDGAPETHGAIAADAHGTIYLLGGQLGTGIDGQSFDSTAAVWTLDTTDDSATWQRFRADLPASRYGGAAAVVDDVLYFFGGDDATRVIAQSESWKLDLSADSSQMQWVRIPDMPRPGDHLNAEVLDGRIIITGGEYAHGISYVQFADTLIYDTADNAWTVGAPMPTPSSHNRSLVHDGRLWVFGGQEQAQIVIDEVRSYDPVADVWELHDPLPHTRKAGYVFQKDDAFYYVAGDAHTGGFPLSTLIGRFAPQAT